MKKWMIKIGMWTYVPDPEGKDHFLMDNKMVYRCSYLMRWFI